MARAPLNISELKFVGRIPKRNITPRDNTEFLEVWSVCALSDDVLLLACGGLGLRAYSLNSSQLSPHEIVAIPDVTRVAFDARTDTLLLLVRNLTTDMWQLVSLRRNASQWLEVTRLTTDMHFEGYFPNIAVCNSHVLIVKHLQGNRLYVYSVSAEHSMSYTGVVLLGQLNWSGLACTRIGDDTYVALSLFFSSLVTLHRLEWPSLTFDPIANNTLENPSWL